MNWQHSVKKQCILRVFVLISFLLILHHDYSNVMSIGQIDTPFILLFFLNEAKGVVPFGPEHQPI